MNLVKNKSIAIDRAINELRVGRPIIINDMKKNWIFFTLEHVDKKLLKEINKKTRDKIFSFITNKKANELLKTNILNKGGVNIQINPSDINWLKSIHLNKIKKLKKNKIKKNLLKRNPKFINDILDLVKNAKMIPCLIGCSIDSKKMNHSIMIFKSNQITNQYKIIAESTKLVSQGYFPIANDHKAKIMIFKSFVGWLEHVVVRIGNPNNKKDINLRIQSACLTGEIFHSLKCDCNQQLHKSIDYLANNGGGYIIHLEQEGRGIGLANKIRAYDLQSKGSDTFEADITMGFLGEERDFTIAVKILKYLGIKKVNLITNNLDKIKVLIKNKIKISKQIPILIKQNKYSAKYYSTRMKKMNYSIKL